jgi:hypothetical protein
MNDRQRDLFLWQWSRRRQPGQTAIAIRGALIGAAGGLLFALIMFSGMGSDNGSTASMLNLLASASKLLVLSVPAFAWLGYTGATRVFTANEAMYQAMLNTGAQIPTQKPILTTADRGPAIAVAITVVIIVGFIGFVFVTLG